MSTPLPLHSAPDSPLLQHVAIGSPTGLLQQSPPLNLPLHVNVVTTASGREPPHYSSLIGKCFNWDKSQHGGPTGAPPVGVVTLEEVIAEGGFGVIFLVKGSVAGGNEKSKYALKRVVVNNAKDYEGVVGEVAVMSVISQKTCHLLRSLTHVITHYPPSTYEIQNLMPLCKQNLLQVASQRMQKSQNFECPELLQILVQVSSGLQYLHTSSPPIIHRDIKIENVLLLDDNTYVLSDFGSATCRQWDPLVDSVVAIQEDLDKNTTLQYRSPEMVDLYGGRGPLGIPSDIWALGVCAFKLISFKDPFESILAIQNRNFDKKMDQVKAKYPAPLVLLVEVLLAEHQSVRPPVDQVIKLTTAALSSDWTLVSLAFNRISEDKKSREEASSAKKQTTQQSSAIIVMETTVTPRQRPKRGVTAAAGVPTTSTVIIPPVLAPPKSPKPVSPSNVGGTTTGGSVDNNNATRFFSPAPPPQQTISPTQQQGTTSATTPSPTNPPPPPLNTSTPGGSVGVGGSWATTSSGGGSLGGGSYNPFDEDYRVPTSSSCDTDSLANNTTTDTSNSTVSNDDSDFDVFANAPFDYFKYQPILMNAGNEENTGSSPSDVYRYNYSNYAANNPFLYPDQDYVVHSSYDLSNNNASSNASLSTGVCNLSFDDGVVNERAANNNTVSNVTSDS